MLVSSVFANIPESAIGAFLKPHKMFSGVLCQVFFPSGGVNPPASKTLRNIPDKKPRLSEAGGVVAMERGSFLPPEVLHGPETEIKNCDEARRS